MKVKPSDEFIYSRYEKELPNELKHDVLLHIPLHAFHKAIYLSGILPNGENRLNYDKTYLRGRKPQYGVSWDIVGRDGHKNIIREFTKRYAE